MDPRVHAAIAKYLNRILETVLWPFLSAAGKSRATSLPAVSSLLTRILSSPCSDNVGGNCNVDEDCRCQTLECVGGTCQPISPLDMAYAPLEEHLPDPGADVKSALDGAFVQIYDSLTRVLGQNPKKLSDIRDLLISFYADAQKLACIRPTPCDSDCKCPAGSECVNGFCVPVPFQLKFRVPGAPVPPPWAP